MHADFNGKLTTVCHNCKTKITLKGYKKNYVIYLRKLKEPKTKKFRSNNEEFNFYCPDCKSLITQIKFNSKLKIICPHCYILIKAVIYMNRMMIYITKDKRNDNDKHKI